MKKHIRLVFILGIGMGLIMSSMLGMIGDKMTNYQKEVMGKLEAVNNISPEDTPTNQKSSVNEEEQGNNDQEPEDVEIVIKEGASSEDIADILYLNRLIADKEDFKILLNLKTLDTMKAGQVLTDHGIISHGWKVTQLLGIMSKKYDKASEKIYQAKLIDDEASLGYIMGIMKEKESVVPGKKIIKRGTSMHEIVKMIIQ